MTAVDQRQLPDKKQFQYGHFECRYRYTTAMGTNNSFWMMTPGITPATGIKLEIDINEVHYAAEVNTSLHNRSDITNGQVTGKSSHPSSGKACDFSPSGVNLEKEFHIFGLKWTSDSVIYYFKGKYIRRLKNEFCRTTAPVSLSEAILSWAGEVTDAIDGTSMDADWVKWYQIK